MAADRKAPVEVIKHATGRVLQIDAEIASVDLTALIKHLTPDGGRLVQTLV